MAAPQKRAMPPWAWVAIALVVLLMAVAAWRGYAYVQARDDYKRQSQEQADERARVVACAQLNIRC